MVNKNCPLCDSPLTASKYNEVFKISEANLKREEELKKQLSLVKQSKEKLEDEKKGIEKKLKKQFDKDKELLIKKQKQDISKAKKQGEDEGMERQKKKFETTSKLLEQKVKELGLKDERIKELQKQLKEGRTPQDAGLDFENELVKELRQKFPHDRIEHHGKGGDILHYIVSEGKAIALIVYECKKTQTHDKSHVEQIKNDMIAHNANYGVLVTFASGKNKSGFWTEKDILIVHPYGASHLAEVLRKSLMQLHSLKLSDKELGEKAKKLLEYIKGNKFRNSIKDNIERTKELNKILEDEVKYHENKWKQRHRHYQAIAQQSSEIEKESKTIVGESSNEDEQIIVQIEPRRKRKLRENFERNY